MTTLTLNTSATTTPLVNSELTAGGAIIFDAITANAAAEKAAGTLYVTAANRGNGTWTVTHANNTQADRTYNVRIYKDYGQPFYTRSKLRSGDRFGK